RRRRTVASREGDREDGLAVPVPPRGARSGPVPAAIGGAAHFELHALAIGVRRTGLPGHAVAGFRPAPSVARVPAVRAAGPAVRRGDPQSGPATRQSGPATRLARSPHLALE